MALVVVVVVPPGRADKHQGPEAREGKARPHLPCGLCLDWSEFDPASFDVIDRCVIGMLVCHMWLLTSPPSHFSRHMQQVLCKN